MLSYKSNSISSVIPNKVTERYPHFVEFMKAYYDWRTKSTFTLKQVFGNFDVASNVRSAESEIEKSIDVIVETEHSYIVEFDTKNTFIVDESIWAFRDHDDPIDFSYDETDGFSFGPKFTNDITLFRGQRYFIRNTTGAPLYIKFARTLGTNQQYGLVDNNGTSDGIISFRITNEFPNFLYFVSALSDNVGTIKIRDVPTEFAGIASQYADTLSILGFSRVEEVLFHTEYLYNVYDDLNSINAPNALLERFLSDHGLETFFRNNFKYRKFFNNFLEFYRKRGTEDGIRFFFRNFFDASVSFDYPGERVIKPSDSDYFSYDEMFVRASFGEELLRNKQLIGKLSGASAIIEASKYFEGRDYYKLFINPSKRVNSFILREPLLVVDDDDSSILHDIDGVVLGTVSHIAVSEPGNEYTVGTTIVDTYDIAGITTTLSLTVDTISSASIDRYEIDVVGSGYQVDDAVYFPTPEKKTVFGAIVQPQPITGDTTYTSNEIAVHIEDYSNYEPIDFAGAQLSIDATGYDVITCSGGDPDIITILSRTPIPVNPTVKSGQLIVLTLDEDSVTDPFYDSAGEFFHPSANKIKRGAKGYVSAVTVSGGVEAITVNDKGAGYIKRPTTANGGVHIVTVSGSGAEINVIGQSFGGVVSVSRNNDIVGPEYNDNIVLDKGGVASDNAVLNMRAGVHSKYGQSFNTNKGFLSDSNYIHDSFFYQDYSYVIQSDLNYSDFSELLKKLTHPAGMIFFNEYFIVRIFKQKLNRGSDIPITSKKITIDRVMASPFTMVGNLTVYIIDMLINVYAHKLVEEFNWASSTINDFESSYTLLDDYTMSGVSVSGYSDVKLRSSTPILRESDETQFVDRIYLSTIKTFSYQSGIDAINSVDIVGTPQIPNGIIAYAYGDGKFVGVGGSGRTAYSNDGRFWSNLPTDNSQLNWNVVAYSPKLQMFVALYDGHLMTLDVSGSTLTWVYRGVSVPDRTYDSMIWSDGLEMFVAVERISTSVSIGNVIYSTDGITWNQAQAAEANSWFGTTWSESLGMLVSVSNDGTNRVMYSYDAITWYSVSVPQYQWRSIAWSESLEIFAAVSYDSKIMTSRDGINWELQTSPSVDSKWVQIVWAEEVGAFIGNATVPYLTNDLTDIILVSVNGVNWYSYDASFSSMWRSGVWNPDRSEYLLPGFGINEFAYASLIYDFDIDQFDKIGTVSYTDTSTGEEYSSINTMTGLSTAFTLEAAADDIVTVSGEEFLVREVISNTELKVQRLNTVGPVSFTDSPFVIQVKRRTELDNARFVDILYYNDSLTISGYLTDTWAEFINTAYIN